MGRIKTNKQRQVFSGIKSFLKKKGDEGGQWLMLSQPLIQCMGLRDAICLTGWENHYRAHCKNLRKDGSFYCSVDGFQSRYGLKFTDQKNAEKNIRRLGLLRISKLKAERNSRNIIFNNVAVYIFINLVYKYKNELQYNHSETSDKGLATTELSQELSNFYKTILKKKSLRVRFKNFVKEIEENCKPEDFEEFDANREIDDNLLDEFGDDITFFYEDFIKRYKKFSLT